jgi:hypothetical protein
VQGNGEKRLGFKEEIERQRRRKVAALYELTQANAEIARLEQLDRVADMTPEQRREDVRRRTAVIAMARRIGAAVGVLVALDWLRSHSRQAVAATALTAAAAVATAPVWTDLDAVVPHSDPPMAIGEDPPKAAPSGGIDLGDAETPTPTSGPSPPASGEAAGPGLVPTPDTAGSGPAPSPPVAPTPPPAGTPGPSPGPTPSPTRPPPSSTPEPTATATATPSPTAEPPETPEPTVTATVTASPPAPPPDIPQECLLFVDIPALLELCLLDLGQGGEGQLLDGALGGRTLFG